MWTIESCSHPLMLSWVIEWFGRKYSVNFFHLKKIVGNVTSQKTKMCESPSQISLKLSSSTSSCALIYVKSVILVVVEGTVGKKGLEGMSQIEANGVCCWDSGISGTSVWRI